MISGFYSRTLTRERATSGVIGRYTGLKVGSAYNHTYSYDGYGRIGSITVQGHADGRLDYTRLAESRLLGQVTGPCFTDTFQYESHRDLMTKLSFNQMFTFYAYDGLGNCISSESTGTFCSGGGQFFLHYNYNDRSEVSSAEQWMPDTNFFYYAYDHAGNRVSLNNNSGDSPCQYTTNNLNQYSAVTGLAAAPSVLAYDDDGNLTSDGRYTYGWDGENQLKTVTLDDSRRLEFSYDHMGRRIEKKVFLGAALQTHLKFVYDGYKLIEELDGLNGDAPRRRYTWQPESVGMDTPLAVFDSGLNVTYYYHCDANKNVTELTDASGDVVAHYEYGPFGETLTSTGAYAATNPFRFSSEFFDNETGLIYYNYRYYSPGLGRWLSRDPIEEQGGWNLYNMCGNNHVNYWDLLRRDFWNSTIRVINNIMIGMTTGATTGTVVGGTAGSLAAGVGAIPGVGLGAVAGGIDGAIHGDMTGIMSEFSGGDEQKAYKRSAYGGAIAGSTGSLGAAAAKAREVVDVGGKAV